MSQPCGSDSSPKDLKINKQTDHFQEVVRVVKNSLKTYLYVNLLQKYLVKNGLIDTQFGLILMGVVNFSGTFEEL